MTVSKGVESRVAEAESLFPSSHDLPVVVIRPSRGWISLNLRDLWEYRELLYFLTWRDVKVRYKQTVLGAAWAIIEWKMENGEWRMESIFPFPLSPFHLPLHDALLRHCAYVECGLVAALVAAGVGDFSGCWFMAHGDERAVSRRALCGAFPGAGLPCEIHDCTGASSVRYLFHRAWMFATPIAYPSSLLDEPWRTLYGINPMAGVVEGFRWALLGTETAPGPIVLVSALVAVGLLVSGAYYFRRMEKTFADVV